MAPSLRVAARAAPLRPQPAPLLLMLLLALLCAGCALVAGDAPASDVNSTGKGYVTIQRNSRNNATEREASETKEADGPAAPQALAAPAPAPSLPPAPASTAETVRSTSLYSINGGKPFFLDRNPITGAVDFPAAVEYDEYVAAEDDGDAIDRRDSAAAPAAGVGRPSYNIFGAKAGNHKYYHSDKVPLISGSYANTKVQGTAGGAHRTRQPTSPTPTPSYYPVRPHQPSPTAPRAPFTTVSTSTTTTTTTTAAPTSSSTTPVSFLGLDEELESGEAPEGPPTYEYEYEYVDNFAAEDGPATVTARPPFTVTTPQPRVTTPSTPPQRISSPLASSPFPVTTARPPTSSLLTSTTAAASRTPSNVFPPSSALPPFSVHTPSSAHPPSSALPPYSVPPHSSAFPPSSILPTERTPTVPASSPLVSRPPPPTSTIVPTVIYKEPGNIVTSMPLGTHFHFRPASQPPSLPKQPDSAPAASGPKPAPVPLPAAPRPDVNTNVVLAPEVSPYGIRAEEPFRPIFGPGEGIEETVPPSRRPVPPQAVAPPPLPSIPPETPTRLNYPPNEGTSNYFVLRPDGGPSPQPPRVPIKPPPPPPALPPPQRPFPSRGSEPAQVPVDRVPVGQKTSGSAPAPWVLAAGGNKPLVKFPGDSEHPTKAPVPGEESKPLAHANVRPPLPPPPPSSSPSRPRPLAGPLPSPATELRPPAQLDGPRPAWDSRPPRPHPHPYPHPPSPSPQTPAHARPKVDVMPPKYIQGGYALNGNRNKPTYLTDRPYHDANTRPEQGHAGGGPGLPNILPQFRPNAKVSHGHGDGNFRHPARPPFFGNPHRAPLVAERLHPPPPPPPPSRLNRNDAEQELPPAAPFPPPPPRPLMRRRTVPQGNEVSTLQMMQLKRLPPAPPAPSASTAPSDKRPVFVVYPSKSDAGGGLGSSASVTGNIGGGGGGDGGVVVGTRGPHLPVPPSNLRLDDKDDLPLGPPFGHAEPQTPLLQTVKERGDVSPLLGPAKPAKSDFPYALVRPDASLPEEGDAEKRKSTVVLDGDEREAFPHSRTPDTDKIDGPTNEEKHGDDQDFNIIPYLQDYLPFATKKPIVAANKTPVSQIGHVEHENKARIVNAGSSGNKIQTSSVHLSPSLPYASHGSDASTSSTQLNSNYFMSTTPKIKDHMQSSTKRPALQQGLVGTGNSEFTVSAIMHTQPQFSQAQEKGSSVVSVPSQLQPVTTQHSNHRLPADNHKVSSTAPALNFQAPFLASVNMGATPTNQGWSVVGSNTEQRMKPGTVDKAELDRSDVSLPQQGEQEPSNFDFENFKPQLFGGFQPIYSLPENTKLQRQQITTERQEKKLL